MLQNEINIMVNDLTTWKSKQNRSTNCYCIFYMKTHRVSFGLKKRYPKEDPQVCEIIILTKKRCLFKKVLRNCKRISNLWSIVCNYLSGPYFRAFGLNAETYRVNLRIQPKCGKIKTRKTSALETFHVLQSINNEMTLFW